MGEPYVHHAFLQRLNVYHQNEGKKVFYSLPAFEQTYDWENIPVITPLDPHQGHQYINLDSGEIPQGYHKVGYITGATIPREGAPRLEADLVLEDPQIEALAKSGELELSTGFISHFAPSPDGSYIIDGHISPNHVLVFPRGVASNCYPNDKGAMIVNQVDGVEPTMTEDADFSEKQKGFFRGLFEGMHLVKNEVPADAQQTTTNDAAEIDALKAEIEKLKQQIAEKDAIIAEMNAANEQAKKDSAWNAVKNQVPQGWLADEPKCRSEFESDPVGFATKLMSHNVQVGNQASEAEGNQTVGNQAENTLESEVAALNAKLGF